MRPFCIRKQVFGLPAFRGAVPLVALRGAGSYIVGDGPVCMLSNGLHTRMARGEEPPMSRGYSVRKIARDKSNDVEPDVSGTGRLQASEGCALRATIAPPRKRSQESDWQALAPYDDEPLCASNGMRESRRSRSSTFTRREKENGRRKRSCAFSTQAVGQDVRAANRNRGRRAGNSVVRPPVIPTSDQVPRPKQSPNALEKAVATTIGDDASRMQTVARGGI